MKRTPKFSRVLSLSLILFAAFSLSSCQDDDESIDCGAQAQPGDSLIVYTNFDAISELWFPGGWMPDGLGITYQDNFEQNPHSAPECIRISLVTGELTVGWCGIYWLAKDSWTGPGVNIEEELCLGSSQSVKLVFWARGEQGGEGVEFIAGGVSDGEDSIDPAIRTGYIELSKEWTLYEIDLAGFDLSNIVGGFGWVTNIDENPGAAEINFFLDDIKYVVQ